MKRLALLTTTFVFLWLCAAASSAPVPPPTETGDYNQGLVLGNNVLLYRATGQASYLTAAERLAVLSAPHSSRVRGYGARLRRALYNRNLALLRGQHLPTFSRAEVEAILRPLEGYWCATVRAWGPFAPSHNNFFYDDNDWIGLDYAKGYELTHDAKLLATAKRAFAFVKTGWVQPGGELWHRLGEPGIHSGLYITTTATAGAEQLALVLYINTRDRSYLAWATRAQVWLEHHMLSPNGLYYDHASIVLGHYRLESAVPLPWTEEKSADQIQHYEWQVSSTIASRLSGEPIPAGR